MKEHCLVHEGIILQIEKNPFPVHSSLQWIEIENPVVGYKVSGKSCYHPHEDLPAEEVKELKRKQIKQICDRKTSEAYSLNEIIKILRQGNKAEIAKMNSKLDQIEEKEERMIAELESAPSLKELIDINPRDAKYWGE